MCIIIDSLGDCKFFIHIIDFCTSGADQAAGDMKVDDDFLFKNKVRYFTFKIEIEITTNFYWNFP